MKILITLIIFVTTNIQIQGSSFSLCKKGEKLLYDTINIDRQLKNHEFEGIDSIENIEFGEHIKRIPSWAFAINAKLRNVKFNPNVSTICDNAFFSCKNLHHANLENVIRIGESAFKASYLDTINLSKVQIISDFAFANCKQLKKIIFPKEYVEIGDFAFSKDTSIVDITISNGCIGSGAFSDCSSLSKVILQDSINEIKTAAFIDCGCLSNIVLPNHLQTIEDMTFMNCKKLERITIPSHVKVIGKSAFYGTAIKEILIPKSVINIANDAFDNCKYLKKIILHKNCNKIIKKQFIKNKKNSLYKIIWKK